VTKDQAQSRGRFKRRDKHEMLSCCGFWTIEVTPKRSCVLWITRIFSHWPNWLRTDAQVWSAHEY
jgi:hypothetical protein